MPSSHEKRNNIERKINEPVKASAAVDNILEIVKKWRGAHYILSLMYCILQV